MAGLRCLTRRREYRLRRMICTYSAAKPHDLRGRILPTARCVICGFGAAVLPHVLQRKSQRASVGSAPKETEASKARTASAPHNSAVAPDRAPSLGPAAEPPRALELACVSELG